MTALGPAERRGIAFLMLIAFAARLAARIALGSERFWTNGYSGYYDMARNFAGGKGLCIDAIGWKCAFWPPVYPLMLASTTVLGDSYLTIVILQAAIGAITVLCAFLIGRELFDSATGAIAAAIAAVYPYYLVHDTALQETSLVACLTAASVWLLLRSRDSESRLLPAAAGLALGAAVLTRASLAPFALLSLLWLACFARHARRKLITILLMLVLTAGSWLVRTQVRIGSPVLSSQTGRALWIGNNPYTFSRYPAESIDESTGVAWAALAPRDVAEIERLAENEIAQSDWFARKGLAYMLAHPWSTVSGACRKLLAGFSWRLNPEREPAVQAAYLISYVPVAVLGAAGMFLSRRRWRQHCLIYAVFLSFAGVTAVFWAHTSHRSYLDIYLMVFAAHAVRQWLAARGTTLDLG